MVRRTSGSVACHITMVYVTAMRAVRPATHEVPEKLIVPPQREESVAVGTLVVEGDQKAAYEE